MHNRSTRVVSVASRAMRTLATAAALLAGAACASHDHDHQDDGGHHHHDGGATSPDEGACEHLAKGPFVDVVAGTGDGDVGAEIAADHRAYRVAVPAGAAGTLRYAAGAAGDLTVYFTKDAPLAIEDDQAVAVPVRDSVASIDACADVKARHTVELPRAGLYLLRVGPVAGDQLTVVIEAGDHDHDH